MNWRRRPATETEPPENPEAILAEMADELRRELPRARELAVVAIAQRNQLVQMMADQWIRAGSLECDARLAEERGQHLRAEHDRKQAAGCRTASRQVCLQAEQAAATAHHVKTAYRKMREELRENVRARLARATDWTAVEIKRRIARVEAETEAAVQARAAADPLVPRAEGRSPPQRRAPPAAGQRRRAGPGGTWGTPPHR